MAEDARDTLLRILDGLKKTAEGNMLYTFISRGVQKFEGTQLNNAFLDFADRLLVRYLTNPDADPSTRVRVKMIQSRLRLYRGDETTTETPAPVVAAPAPVPESTSVHMPESQAMQLAQRMDQALAQGQSLDELLRSSIEAIDAGNDPGLAALRSQLKRGVEELLDEQKQLQQQLTTTRSEMRALDDDRRELEARISKLREHSLTDELTGLPNREAFLKQLEAEVGRARRYGFSLAVALLDIDGLRGVNNRYGQSAGNVVLNTYAAEIVSQFRGYDLVARYGGDEFAVLLPNTQKDGASRAIDKARKLANSTYIDIEGASIPLPTFSSVLTLYAHGESPSTLLKRADDALMRAKHKGASQAVVALPPR